MRQTCTLPNWLQSRALFLRLGRKLTPHRAEENKWAQKMHADSKALVMHPAPHYLRFTPEVELIHDSQYLGVLWNRIGRIDKHSVGREIHALCHGRTPFAIPSSPGNQYVRIERNTRMLATLNCLFQSDSPPVNIRFTPCPYHSYRSAANKNTADAEHK